MLKWIVVVVLAAGVLIPFPTELAPDFTVRFVDEQGLPLAGVKIWQTCTHYTYQSNTDTCDSYPDNRQETNNDGEVHFSRKVVRFGLLSRALRAVFHYSLLIAHGSVGRDVTLFTSGNAELESRVIRIDPDNPPREVVLKKSEF